MTDYARAPLMAAGLHAALAVLDDDQWHPHEELFQAITATGLAASSANSIMRDIRRYDRAEVRTASKFLPGTSPLSYRASAVASPGN